MNETLCKNRNNFFVECGPIDRSDPYETPRERYRARRSIRNTNNEEFYHKVVPSHPPKNPTVMRRGYTVSLFFNKTHISNFDRYSRSTLALTRPNTRGLHCSLTSRVALDKKITGRSAAHQEHAALPILVRSSSLSNSSVHLPDR
jgi:hypothetical protein